MYEVKLHIYENLLQQYAQKRCLIMSVYANKLDYPPHALHYKSHHTKVAREVLSIVKTQEARIYKNVLQEMAQKEGLMFLSYETSQAGPHKIGFVSFVVVGNDTFQGIEAKTKKQTKANATEVAHNNLT
ncbi:double-stranded RNA-binding protein 4-like [Olea europaea var. sylvestris]|uniref:double-stranded RNA-binding protein 4-like n=1 Tax=Olea europaea var. sylvestris TaxID=158386 RepID=UPI000C1D34B4|nr:double-stranded RNA-binding protein 4-like [Olea europaea var. sylvestris]